MGKVISIGLQKGGVGKTTTSAIVSYLLSKDSKVLAIDFDPQGNLTQFLSQEKIDVFHKKTVYEAMQLRDPSPYIKEINPNLHLLPADDLLSVFPVWLNQRRGVDRTSVLKETIHSVKNDYDYILIDLPPNLGDHTVNGLVASDYAIVMLQSEPMSYDALDRYIDTLIHIKRTKNRELVLCGILPTLIDSRSKIDKSILEKARLEYNNIVFNTIIKRKNIIKEFSAIGIHESTKSDIMALKNYSDFVEELKLRVV